MTINLQADFPRLDLDAPDAPFVQAAPPRPGPAVLLAHGFLMSRALWLENLPAFCEIGRPVLVELLGHARSPAPAIEAAYRVERYVAWFEEIRARLGLAQWVLCGHSLGAGLVLHYALRHPEAVAAVIVTNSLSAFDALDANSAQAHVAAVAEAVAQGGAEALTALPYHPRLLRGAPDAIRQALIADAQAHDPSGVEKTMRITGAQVGVSTRLQEIQPPVLLVNGLREKRFQPARDAAARAAPGVEIVDVDGGHSINAERADAFNAAAVAFLRRHMKEPP